MFAIRQNEIIDSDNIDIYESQYFSDFINKKLSMNPEAEKILRVRSCRIENVEHMLYDACILYNILDFSNEPGNILQSLHAMIKKNGILLLCVVTRSCVKARKSKTDWSVFAGNQKQFFDDATIQNILCRYGYSNIQLQSTKDNMVYISCHTSILRENPLLSIIIPVYNEAKTILTLLNKLYYKNVLGIDKEYIIVESNSTDGTRAIILGFAKEHNEVKIILEDKPLGKGHAVRAGFKEAAGDFISIQDGDLEYDIDDYDLLIKPLVYYQKAFVLGSRHVGNWKIRKFGNKRKIRATIMNIGHFIFTTLINFGCKTRLKDPFTMYKLFRKECLFGLEFDGKRFEIDWEIVIKLTRKGFTPIEIPINYRSRGYDDGKKVSFIKDPFIWLYAFFKYTYIYKIKI
jgi:hypothetical protein